MEKPVRGRHSPATVSAPSPSPAQGADEEHGSQVASPIAMSLALA